MTSEAWYSYETWRKKTWLGGRFKYFYFHPYLEKWSNLTNIFQMGWNHQLDDASFFYWANYSDLFPPVGHLKWWFGIRESVPKITERFRFRNSVVICPDFWITSMNDWILISWSMIERIDTSVVSNTILTLRWLGMCIYAYTIMHI